MGGYKLEFVLLTFTTILKGLDRSSMNSRSGTIGLIPNGAYLNNF